MSEKNIKQELTEEDVIEMEEIFDNNEDDFEENADYVKSTDFRENAIEWYNGNDIITITLSQRRFINKVNNLAKLYPNEVKIDKINDDGTMLAHIPLSYLKIQRPRTMSEEEKEKARERLAKYRKK